MLKESQMDKKYWAEAFTTAVYVRNMINYPVNQGKSPYEATMKRKPDLTFTRGVGCTCFAHVPKHRRSKLDDTAVKCKLLGYSEDQKTYRVINNAIGDVFNSRRVTFKEIDDQSSASFDLLKFEGNYSRDNVKKEDYKGQKPLQNQSVSNKPTMIGPFNSHTQYNETESQHPLQQDNRVELQDDSTVQHQYQNMYRYIPGRSKVTAFSESPRCEVLDARDKHSDKKYALPDFQLMDEDGPMDVYCLIASTVDERESTYDRIMSLKIAISGSKQWKMR
jgi:hypothetical protein